MIRVSQLAVRRTAVRGNSCHAKTKKKQKLPSALFSCNEQRFQQPFFMRILKNTRCVWTDQETLTFCDLMQGTKVKSHIRWEAAMTHLFASFDYIITLVFFCCGK